MALKLETHEARLREALRGTEERHRLILESTAEGIFGLDIEGRCTFINKAAATMLGYQASDCLGKDIYGLIHHGPLDGSPRPVENGFIFRAKRFGHTSKNESATFWRSDGSSFPVDYSSHPIWADGDHVSGAVVTFSDTTERKRTEETLRQRVREIEALHDIGQTIISSSDLKGLAEKILDKIFAIGGFDIGVIRLLEPNSNTLLPVASRGYPSPETIRPVSVDLKTSNVGRAAANVFESKGAYVIESVATSDGLRTFKREGISCAVAVPIRAEDEVVGTIQLGSRAPRKFKPEETRLLEAIGNQLGIAVQKSRLNEAMQRNLDRIRALHEIDRAITSTLDLRQTLDILLEKIDLFLPYAVTTIRLVDKETGLLEPVACRNLDEAEWKTITRQAPGRIDRMLAQDNCPVFSRNVQTDPRSLAREFLKKHGLVSSLRVPLLVKGEIVGIITFFTKEEHEFCDEEIELLTTLAGQAAIAIHNAQLFEQTQQRKREAEELARVAQSLTETLDMMAVGQRIVTSVREIFGVKGSTLRLLQPDGSFRALASRGEVFSRIPGGAALPPATGVTSRAVAEGRPIWCRDTLSDPEIRLSDQMRDHQLRTGNRAMIAVPLRARDKIIGALTLSDQTGRAYTNGEVALLQTFSDQAAIAINNAQLYEALQRANKVKEEFLGIMSHELRTPLNVIIGYSSLIRDGMLGEINHEQENALKKVMIQSTELLSMLNSILQATQIESGNVVAETADVFVGQLLADLESIYELPLDKEITINWDYPPLPAVKTDSDKLRQILRNLIDNAIKFTAKGQVTVAARFQESQGHVVFKVSDTGPGIPQESLPVIFEMFRQLDNSDTRTHGGVGLGLYIVKKFTDLLGGEISVDSEPGRGSVFTIALPVDSQAGGQSYLVER